MAIIDTLRFRNILVDGRIAEEAPAEELVSALDEAFEEQLAGVATKSDLLQQTAETNAQIAEIKAQIASLEARLTRTIMWVAFGIIATLSTLMTLLTVFVD